MAGWLDRLAKRAADPAPASSDQVTRAPSEPANRPAPSRRDFLKKAGIVGGLAWSVPVMQSVVAPAHAASNTPIGGVCSGAGSVCANGNAFCNGAICGGPGASCPTGSSTQCVASSPCSRRTPGGVYTCGGPGAVCSTDANCTYGNCRGGACGGFNAPCTTVGDNTPCATGFTCQQNGTNIRCR